MALIDSYNESNQTSFTNFNTGAGIFRAGQSVLIETGIYLETIKFYMKKAASPTGTGNAKIYAHSGTFGTSSVATGSALATSDNFDVSTLTTSFTLKSFNFSGANRILLTPGYYFITFETGAGDPINQVSVGYDDTSPTHGGNYAEYTGSWAANSGRDFCFYLYGGLVGSPGNRFRYVSVGDGMSRSEGTT